MAKSLSVPKPKAVKAVPGAPKFKLPTTKTPATPTPKLPTTGLGGYLNASKLMNPPKPPKNGLNASAASQA